MADVQKATLGIAVSEEAAVGFHRDFSIAVREVVTPARGDDNATLAPDRDRHRIRRFGPRNVKGSSDETDAVHLAPNADA
ncbi:hypothetical protein D3C83_99020 [compost metagenome]